MLEFFLICQLSIDILIKNLGDENYQTRKSAYSQLEKIGYEKIDYLKENMDHKDLEIKLSCIQLYESYFYLTDEEGEIPSIWFLDDKERFPNGYEIKTFEDKSLCYLEFEKDVALEYFDNYKELDNCYDDYCDYMEYCDCVFYRNVQTSKLAMKDYIKDQLSKGRDRNKIKKIIIEASKKMKTHKLYFKTKDITGKNWDWWHEAPGPTILLKDYKYPGY